MPFLLLKLLGIGRWLREAATALLGAIGRYPREAAIVALLLASVWQYRGKQNALADLAAEKVAHAETIKQNRAASDQAKADQDALFADNQALSQRIAENAISRHHETVAASDRAIAGFADSNGLRKACTARIGTPAIAPVPADPGAPVDPGPGPDMVAVPRAEFEQIAKSAVQGRESTSFLIEQVNAGLAVVWPEPRE